MIEKGWLVNAKIKKSPFFSPRADTDEVSLLVIHNISLPAGCFNTPYIDDLFLGKLDCSHDQTFNDLQNMQVSAHCLIRRTGELIQYVSFEDKAWHAGVSLFKGRDKCNDFSIGIELEGCDDIPYTQQQYQQLVKLTLSLQQIYPEISRENIVGHCHIAPQRKTDPGQSFDWQYFRASIYSYPLKK